MVGMSLTAWVRYPPPPELLVVVRRNDRMLLSSRCQKLAAYSSGSRPSAANDWKRAASPADAHDLSGDDRDSRSPADQFRSLALIRLPVEQWRRFVGAIRAEHEDVGQPVPDDTSFDAATPQDGFSVNRSRKVASGGWSQR